MESIFTIFAFFLIFNIILGFSRVIKGPRASDRMIAAYLVGTMGAGILLCLSYSAKDESFIDVALLFTLLGPMALIAFVNRLWSSREIDE